MEKIVIINALVNNAGTDYDNAGKLAEDLMGLKEPFKGFLERWIENPSDIQDYELEGISISGLMKNSQLSYPAALSSMNWILCEGKVAVDYILSH